MLECKKLDNQSSLTFTVASIDSYLGTSTLSLLSLHALPQCPNSKPTLHFRSRFLPSVIIYLFGHTWLPCEVSLILCQALPMDSLTEIGFPIWGLGMPPKQLSVSVPTSSPCLASLLHWSGRNLLCVQEKLLAFQDWMEHTIYSPNPLPMSL